MKKLILTLVALFTVLLSAIPLAALADTTPPPAALYITPTVAKIGDRITVTGNYFNKSTNTVERHLAIFLAADQAFVGETIAIINPNFTLPGKVTHYAQVGGDIIIDTQTDAAISYAGFPAANFTIPSLLNHGDPATAVSVSSGTHYVYACYYSTAVGVAAEVVPVIVAIATITINAGKISLSGSQGAALSSLSVTGTSFLPNQPLAIRFDSTVLRVNQGDTKTTATGSFNSTVSVPPGTAGTHTVTAVTMPGADVSTDFNMLTSVSSSPQSGAPNTPVSVKGYGFANLKSFTVTINNIQVASDTTTADGSVAVSFFLSPAITAGQFNLVVKDADGNQATSAFTVTAPPATTAAPTPTPGPSPSPSPTPAPPGPPTAVISPATGNVGTPILVSGSNFKAGAALTIKYDNDVIGTPPADTRGSFAVIFKAPASKAGQHAISVSDGANSQQLSFTVQSQTLSAPAPASPAPGATLTTATFDWADVTSPNAPVTYSFQVASDKDFTSTIVNKTGLPSSDYALTQDEATKLKLNSVYYWRVKAVDAASNESALSPATPFTLGGGGGLPAWGIYILAALVAILLLIVGVWVGKRGGIWRWSF